MIGARVRRAIVLLVAFGWLADAAVAQAPVPPPNDDYLQSYRLMDSQGRPPRSATYDVQDTTEATVQADVLTPRGTGGVETTDCEGVKYGRTIWYDVIPDEYGAIHLQSAGRDGVIAVYQYELGTGRLIKRVSCVNQPGLQDELDLYLDKGKLYTVQLGGVDTGTGAAGGRVQFTQRFFEDRDHDTVIDAEDKCAGTKGTHKLKGCLPEVDAVPTFSWAATGSGVSVRALTVSATGDGGKVTVRCCGGRRTARKLRHRRADFTDDFKTLPAGSTLTVTVTRPGTVGQQFSWPINKSGVGAKRSVCVLPGTGKPPKHGTKCQ